MRLALDDQSFDIDYVPAFLLRQRKSIISHPVYSSEPISPVHHSPTASQTYQGGAAARYKQRRNLRQKKNTHKDRISFVYHRRERNSVGTKISNLYLRKSAFQYVDLQLLVRRNQVVDIPVSFNLIINVLV